MRWPTLMLSLKVMLSFKLLKAINNLLCFDMPSGILSEDLHLFLETNMPKPGKKGTKFTLGVIEPKLGAAITEALAISCNHIGVVPEIIRGIRVHFASLVKGRNNQFFL